MTALHIESLDLKGQGVARNDGKTIFVQGALPGERVEVQTLKRKPSYETAKVSAILKESAQRVTPRCPHFGVCGGCAMQHLDPSAQVAVKQRALEDQFWHIGRLQPERILPPIHGPAWGYRLRARFSVRVVPKKGGVLVGFHERQSSYVADMTECHVVPRRVSDLLKPLRALIASMSVPDRMPQIEVAVGDTQLALVLRHLVPLSDADLQLLRQFAQQHGISWWLQPGGPSTVAPLDSADADGLAYLLPEFGLRMPYRPTDFTQVNAEVNRVMVSRALALLAVRPGDRVADFFCGLGNFTLPLAQQVGPQGSVLGVEGSATLTERGRGAAAQWGLSDRTRFETVNLFAIDTDWLKERMPLQRILLDPPREGAEALARALSAPDMPRPQRMVYVSCDPATLARDAAILIHEGGWRLKAAGVMNMFPHTAHVESMAVFEPGEPSVGG